MRTRFHECQVSKVDAVGVLALVVNIHARRDWSPTPPPHFPVYAHD